MKEERAKLSEAAGNVVDIYKRHALAFDRLRTRALFEKGWLDRFVDAMPHKPRILDIGCGMGEPIGTYLTERGCRITGIDSSQAMLDLARNRFPDHRWLEADMRTLSLGERFDGLIAWDSFFLLSPADQRGMFPIFAAHSTQGAPLLFTTGPRAGEVISEFEDEPLYAASLENQDYRILLSETGFEVIEQRNEDPDCDYHTVWLVRRM
ncbi:methyltransferase domain-containing protein [Fulvimarina sp. MAC3]|uniref:class I SAM-dependent DNA methyltransferase n=1 Tax=Fulvimarina sp. MAC3 TaxID=3148887 RepID=UPI0031FD5795